ncbi:MAG: hypothetical protein EHM59_03675 [Betaproteobacteria bacterium]|nr:MAG: hypothetical protein EHM59_03675 [Betaproteobacteria bacterium]
MANISNHQIAELLVGIARAQQAIVEAIESMKPGFRSTHLSPALMNAARVRDTHRPLQLSDLPARVLLQCMGRNGADVDRVARDLEEILARRGDDTPGSLDMTKVI